MNILKKTALIVIVLIGLPMISSAAEVSCAPQYYDDYVGKTITWNGEITDDSDLGEVLSTNWALGNGPTPSGFTTTNIYNTTGIKHAVFSVTGASSSAEVTCKVLIHDENTLPTLNGSCVPNVGSAVLNQPVRWTSSISGGLAPYTINWGGDASGSGDTVTVNYTATGTKVAQIINIASRYPELPVYTDSINCSPSVDVYDDSPSEVFVDNGTTCSASATSVNTGTSVTWSVDLKTLNGVGPYIISWTGSDELSGNGMTINKIYSTAGTKTAKIYSITSSDGQSIESEINCSNSVNVSVLPVSSGGGGGSVVYDIPVVSTSTTATSTSTTTNPLTEVLGIDESSISTSTASTTSEIATTTQDVLSLQDTNKFNLYDPYVFNNDEYLGVTNEDVANLQNRLIQEGYFSSRVTGYFGPITAASLKAYQIANNLSDTGMLDSETRSKLNGVIEGVATSTTGNNLNLAATALNSSDWLSSVWVWILLLIVIIIIFFILWKRRKEDKNNKN